jgi:hypothetical protein
MIKAEAEQLQQSPECGDGFSRIILAGHGQGSALSNLMLLVSGRKFGGLLGYRPWMPLMEVYGQWIDEYLCRRRRITHFRSGLEYVNRLRNRLGAPLSYQLDPLSEDVFKTVVDLRYGAIDNVVPIHVSRNVSLLFRTLGMQVTILSCAFGHDFPPGIFIMLVGRSVTRLRHRLAHDTVANGANGGEGPNGENSDRDSSASATPASGSTPALVFTPATTPPSV